MRVIKKIIIIVVAFSLLYIFSYHDKNDSSQIIDITYINYLGEYEIKKYTNKLGIEKITNKLQWVSFYPVINYRLQESPTSCISIKYTDGSIKEFHMAGMFVMISTQQNGISEDNTKFYIVNPYTVKRIFK